MSAERNFLLQRMIHGDHRWVGLSSTAMLSAVMAGGEPKQEPRDAWDLSRCIVTRRLAPSHLHERMDEILEAWCYALEYEADEREAGGHSADWLRPATAIKQADEDTPAVRRRLEPEAERFKPEPTP